MQLADKKMEIYSISEVVIIHLKRFRNNRKIENLVEFPIEGLDLTKYLPKTKDKYIYDLFAVANHTGGLHCGHYYAYCKNVKDGEWYEFNDSHVSKIEKKKVCSETDSTCSQVKKACSKFTTSSSCNSHTLDDTNKKCIFISNACVEQYKTCETYDEQTTKDTTICEGILPYYTNSDYLDEYSKCKYEDGHCVRKKKDCSETAYVLFYKRKREENEKINEEELFNKPFVEIDCSKYKSN